jgi:hypothetical protein
MKLSNIKHLVIKHWGEHSKPRIVSYVLSMKTVLSLLIGIGWISFIAWRIAILERQPYVIVQRLSVLQVVIVLCIMTWSVVEMASIYRQLSGQVQPNSLVKALRNIIDIVYWKPLLAVETCVLWAIPSMRVWLTVLGDALVSILNTKHRIVTVLLMSTLLPRLLVGVCLGVDIVVYQQVAWMYKAIFILIIPILFNTMVGMIKHNAEGIKTHIEEHGLVVTYSDGQPYVQSRGTIVAVLNYESNKRQWVRYYNILDTTTAIDIVKSSPIILYMRAITVIIFILSWTVYLLIIMKYLHFKYHLYKAIRIKTRI